MNTPGVSGPSKGAEPIRIESKQEGILKKVKAKLTSLVTKINGIVNTIGSKIQNVFSSSKLTPTNVTHNPIISSNKVPKIIEKVRTNSVQKLDMKTDDNLSDTATFARGMDSAIHVTANETKAQDRTDITNAVNLDDIEINVKDKADDKRTPKIFSPRISKDDKAPVPILEKFDKVQIEQLTAEQMKELEDAKDDLNSSLNNATVYIKDLKKELMEAPDLEDLKNEIFEEFNEFKENNNEMILSALFQDYIIEDQDGNEMTVKGIKILSDILNDYDHIVNFDIQTVIDDLNRKHEELLDFIRYTDEVLSQTNHGVLLYNWVNDAEGRGFEPNDPEEIYKEILRDLLEEGDEGVKNYGKEVEQAAIAQTNKFAQQSTDYTKSNRIKKKDNVDFRKNAESLKTQPSKKGSQLSFDEDVLVREAIREKREVASESTQKLEYSYTNYESGKERVRQKPKKFIKATVSGISIKNDVFVSSKSIEDMSRDDILGKMKEIVKKEMGVYLKRFADNPRLVERYTTSIENKLESYVQSLNQHNYQFIIKYIKKRPEVREAKITPDLKEDLRKGMLADMMPYLKKHYGEHVTEDSLLYVIFKKEITDFIIRLPT